MKVRLFKKNYVLIFLAALGLCCCKETEAQKANVYVKHPLNRHCECFKGKRCGS